MRSKQRAHFSDTHDQQIFVVRRMLRYQQHQPENRSANLKGDGGPAVTMLTKRRIEISIGNNKIWQASRTRKVA